MCLRMPNTNQSKLVGFHRSSLLGRPQRHDLPVFALPTSDDFLEPKRPGLECLALFHAKTGVTREQVMAEVRKVLANYPQASVEEINFNPPSYCPPDGAMVGIIQKNVQELRGFKPQPIVSLGGTDARLWRYRDIPAYVYGPFPYGMGSQDEHVDVEEFLHIVRVHVLSAYDYLVGE